MARWPTVCVAIQRPVEKTPDGHLHQQRQQMLLVRRLAPVHHAVLHHRFTGFQLLPVGAAHGTGELVIDRADQGAHGAVVVDGIPVEVARFNVECAVVACFDVVRLQLLALRLDDARRFFLGVCLDGGSLAEGVLCLGVKLHCVRHEV